MLRKIIIANVLFGALTLAYGSQSFSVPSEVHESCASIKDPNKKRECYRELSLRYGAKGTMESANPKKEMGGLYAPTKHTQRSKIKLKGE
ncbi:MAG: hypothetical protein IE916_00370 [Epsilonproteobacteria bacterium]|nr:hypothetical protein [Campylobacterota bacterium]